MRAGRPPLAEWGVVPWYIRRTGSRAPPNFDVDLFGLRFYIGLAPYGILVHTQLPGPLEGTRRRAECVEWSFVNQEDQGRALPKRDF